MKIALYARVSSETQAKEGTIESQLEALREYAKKNKLDISYECLDNGYSGTTLVRPGLDQLRDLAQAGNIEGILILSPDRLSRNQANQIILMEEFKKRNVQLIFTNQNFGDSPEDNLMLQIQGAISEYERTKILDRMRRGIVHAVKNGQINGSNPPLGYNYIPKTKDKVGHLKINPEEAKIVRYIFNLYTKENLKGTAIAKKLNDEIAPVRDRRYWWGRLIYRILKNEVYAGTAFMFKNKSVEPKKGTAIYRKRKNSSKTPRPRTEWQGISVPPIVDRETWERAQKLLILNSRKSSRNNKKNDYLLRGLVHCGLCNSVASGYVSNKNTYYSCGAKRHKNVTSKPHEELVQIKHKLLDESVWTGLIELLSDPENLKAQLEKRIQAKQSKLPSNQDTIEIDRDLEKLETQEKRIVDAYREEVINLSDLKEQKGKIANKRQILLDKKKAVLSHVESPGRLEITMKMLGDISARFQRVMAKADFANREKLVNLLVSSVTLLPDKAIITGNIPATKLDALETPRFTGRLVFCRVLIESIYSYTEALKNAAPPIRAATY